MGSPQDTSAIRSDVIRLRIAVKHCGQNQDLTRMLLRLPALPANHRGPVLSTERWTQTQYDGYWTSLPIPPQMAIGIILDNIASEVWQVTSEGGLMCHPDDQVQQRVMAIREEMTPEQAGTIVSEIIPTLRPVQGSRVSWDQDPSSGKHIMTMIPQRETLLLYDQMTRPGSRLFHLLVNAVLRRYKVPVLCHVQLVALALLALGGTADETAIRDWLLEHIAYYHTFKQRAMRVLFDGTRRLGNLQSILWTTRDRYGEDSAFEPRFPTVDRQVDSEEAHSRGLVWHLPCMNVDHLFKSCYEPPYYVPFWDHPRPWSDSQLRTRSDGRTPQLMDLPPEVRGLIAQYIIPTRRRISIRGFDKMLIFQDLPCNELEGEHFHCDSHHHVPIKRILKFFATPGFGRDTRLEFFSTNTFFFDDVLSVGGTVLPGVYAAQPFLKKMSRASLERVRKVDIVLHIDADRKSSNTRASEWVLNRICGHTHLTRLRLDIRCDGIHGALGPRALEHPVFEALRNLYLIQNLEIRLSEDIPGLEASLREDIDLSSFEVSFYED